MPIWLQLLVPVAVSAAILAGVPRRFLLRALGAWLLSPAFIYWALVAVESGTRSGPDNPLATAVFGFLLVASVAAIPWLVLCLSGMGIGLIIRNRWASRERASVPSGQDGDPVQGAINFVVAKPPAHALAVGHATPVVVRAMRATVEVFEQGSAWREAHIGFADDALALHGIEVWKTPWRPLRLRPLQLPHPAHPAQFHSYAIHEAGHPDRAVRFAASELSNGVWGFYVPANVPLTSDKSADGSIVFRREGIPADRAPDASCGWIVLGEASSGQVLADCRSWSSSQVLLQPDGSMLLRLQESGFDVLIRITPLARTFANLCDPARNFPLATLAGVLEQLLLTVHLRAPSPCARQISPDGLYRVDLHAAEWSNSHWVNSPQLIENASDHALVDLRNTDWDATVRRFATDLVRLDLRSYVRGVRVEVDIDPGRRRFRRSLLAPDHQPARWSDLPSPPVSFAAAVTRLLRD
ncbi:MAG: hypothetical protein ABI650_10900 [Dokdonella sp.]